MKDELEQKEIEQKEIKEAIDFLADNFDKNIIDVSVKEYYDKVQNYINLSYDIEEQLEQQQQEQQYILFLIRQKYRPTFLEPNTVGSYLWGCSQNYYGDVIKPCSLLCVNSIPYDSNMNCQYSIWYYDKFLEKKTNVSSSKAYIYVTKNWTSFKSSDISFLKTSGIYSASILTTFDSKHKILIEMTSVDNLPISKDLDIEIGKLSTSTINYSSYFFCLILTIFIISYLYFHLQ